ncbi:MAG: hypothetical protein JSU00_07075 [Acidobacteria bacterium]|nr:hypothetical protein [Acidobacteriota bacterium]
MSHLTSEQISDYLSAASDGGVQRHLAGCAQCRSEVERLDAALRGFRAAIHQWAEAPSPPPAAAGLRNPWWVALAVAAVLLVCVLLSRQAPAPIPAAAPASDAALLNQIDSDAARTVPAPMEPLSQLVSWDPEE